MTPEVFDALRCAVNIAREQQVEKVVLLRLKVELAGHAPTHVDEALKFWSHREAQLGDPQMRGWT